MPALAIDRMPLPRCAAVAALNDEAGDHSVKDDTVVVAALARLAGVRIGPLAAAGGEPDEAGHGVGRDVLEQADLEVAQVRVEHGLELALTGDELASRGEAGAVRHGG
jgi:hypothetical protein